MAKCRHCGTSVDRGEVICPRCGRDIFERASESIRPAAPTNVRNPEAARGPIRKQAPALTCAKCGSSRIVPQALTWAQAGEWSGGLGVYVYAKPQVRLFRGRADATLYARVCAECGYAEFYAKEKGAQRLYAAYSKSLESGGEA